MRVKFDGFRVQLHKDGRDVQVYLRSGVDFTERFVTLAAAMLAAPAKSFVIDGELVVSGPGDCPDFHALFRRDYHPDQLEVWRFDVHHLNGRDLRARTLKERRARSSSFFENYQGRRLRRSVAFPDAAALLAECDRRQLEGIVSKRVDAPYRSGTDGGWVKVKCPRWREANQERYKLF